MKTIKKILGVSILALTAVITSSICMAYCSTCGNEICTCSTEL